MFYKLQMTGRQENEARTLYEVILPQLAGQPLFKAVEQVSLLACFVNAV